jgi:hypothetical protein
MKRTKGVGLLALFGVANSSQGCAPVFSDLQGARVLAPGKMEVTPGVSMVYPSGDDRPGQREMGVQVAAGTAPGFELRARYVRVSGIAGAAGNVFAVGPKIALVPDRLALHLPMSFAGDGTISGLTLSPTLLGTLPLSSTKVDFNLSGKAILPLSSGSDKLVAIDAGLALSPDLSCWAVRPEVGMLFNPGDDGYFVQVSLGLSFAIQ